MRKATEKELDEAKQKLQKEKEDALKKLTEQHQKEQDGEEERLAKEHEAVMKTLGEKAREDALEEKAMLQEGKQDAMRKLKQQLQREQEQEEAELRKKKDEALKLLREELEEQEEQENDKMADEREKALRKMRETFAAEMEDQRKKLKDEQSEAIEELREKLEKEKEMVSLKRFCLFIDSWEGETGNNCKPNFCSSSLFVICLNFPFWIVTLLEFLCLGQPLFRAFLRYDGNLVRRKNYLVSKVIRIRFGFALLRYAIGSKISCHFFIQSEVKPKPTMSFPNII